MTDQGARLEIVTRNPLKVGERQSRALRITTEGNDGVFVVFPLGDDAAALMSRQAFEDCVIDFSQQRPRGVLAIQPFPEKSCFRVPISRPEAELAFEISLEAFLVNAHPGTVEVTLHANSLSAPPADGVTVVKWTTPPRITSFTAAENNVIRGRRVPLSWALSQEADYELVNATKPDAPLQVGRGTAGASAPLPGGDYLLRALTGSEPADTRHLRIHAFGATGFESYELNLPTDPPITDILGLYPHPGRGRLYALLRTGSGARCAQLWSTSHGFDPDPDAWEPETNAGARRSS